MPGSVSNAVPVTVMPWSLCRQFVHAREYPLLENEYRDGESQRSLQASTSRKSWRLAKRLSSSVLATLRAFFVARHGSTEPFYFYDHTETIPRNSYDPTGTATIGRYTVRFEGAWEQTNGISRSDVSIAITELA